MNKRNILLAAMVVLVLVFSVLGYLGLKQEPDKASPYQAMPLSTTAVLTINNYTRTYENLLQNNLMWQELVLDEEVKELANYLILFDSLIQNDAWSMEFAEELKWHIAFQRSGEGFGHTFIIPTGMNNLNHFKDWFMKYGKMISPYADFEKVNIWKSEFNEGLLEPIYFAYEKGLLMASLEPNLVEDAIRTLHGSESLKYNQQFAAVEKTSGSFADWNFFINYNDPNSLKLLGFNPGEMVDSRMMWSDWTALDATVHPDLFLLNGFSNASESSYLSVFEKQKSQDIDAIEIIPDDVSLFFHFGLSNYKAYAASKRKFFKQVGREEAYKAKIEDFKQTYGFDIEHEFDQWVSNEFGLMYLPDDSKDATDSKVAFFRLSDIRRTTAVLENLAQSEGTNNIAQLPMDHFLDDFEIVLFNDFNKPYYTIIDKYLLISTHADLLEKVRNQYLQANTLKKSELYARFSGNLSDQSNIYIYIHLESGKEVYDGVLNQNSLSFFTDNPNFSKKFEQVGIQFKDGRKDMFYQHMAMNFNPKQRSQGNVLWEAVLDTYLIMKPQIVYNHYTNSREIFVQDVANTIYLIDNKGNVIWKRSMKERIHGKVAQIDVFKNNKLQMLFSGESSIYLIDRKGRDVENFPIQLKAVATNDLAIIDYEKNREYRLLIGVRGGEILNYDRFGKSIKGWKFNSKDEVTYPIDYFLLNGKDYIVSVGSEGQPYILNRKGDIRLKIDEKLPKYSDKGYVLELSNDINQCKFVTTDESGNFIKLKFNGEKEVVNLDPMSANHQFLYDDLNNDRKNDFILLDSNRLMAYNSNKDKIFEVELEGKEIAHLNMYRFDSGYGKIGFTDIETGQIFLYRDAGGLDNNFPLKGNTAFTITDINKDGREDVIVGLNERLIVYNLK